MKGDEADFASDCTVGRAQNNLRKEEIGKWKSRKWAFLTAKRRTADFVGCAQGHFLL